MNDDVSLAAKKEMASRILSRRRFLPFVQRINPRYTAGWVHEDIARRLENFSDDVANGLSPRLMILMPPRAGKSELASKTFPAWHLGRHPDHEFIACSYNLDLAMDFSKKIKAVLDSDAYQQVFDTRLDPDNRSSASWGVHKNIGGYVAAGIGGGINGKGAHVLVIDDPIKNAEEADSAGIRESIWNWFGSVAYTRLAPGGGVLVIQCMTGDTPVLMANNVERRLDSLTIGDSIATYANGTLDTSTVRAIRSNGRDSVYKITTKCGKIVRANGRHPFLVAINGELKWVRTRSLSTAHRIVTLKANVGSGLALHAQLKDARSQLAVEGSARRTTLNRSGLTGTDRLAPTPNRDEMPTSSTGMGSLLRNMMLCLKLKAGSALSVINHLVRTKHSHIIGRASSPSITATTQVKSEDYYVTDVMQESDTLELSSWHLPQPDTSDFTLDEIVSIEPDGIEEVFDLQVDRTENFIANGLVSHNTWWHDDDLAGRLQEAMKSGDEDVNQFEIVKYPAIAELDEYIDEETNQIIRLGTNEVPEAHYRALRKQGEALHPERFPLKALRGIKATLPARFWSALYQQNPVPDDGNFFTKDMFKRGALPDRRYCNVSISWDFAIGVNKKNDYTVGTVTLQDHNDMVHVAEMIRFKSNDLDFIVSSILSLARRWYHPSLIIGFEDGHIYKTMASTLKKAMQKESFYPSTKVLPPLTDKEVRATPLQGRMQQGMVSFNSVGEWYDIAHAELLRFPSGIHDDCVDSLAWNIQMVLNRQAPKLPKLTKEKSWKDRLRLGASGTSHMAA